MRIANINLLEDDGAVDLSADWESEPIWLGHIIDYAVQLVFTDTPNGTFKLQASNDPGECVNPTKSTQDAKVENWTDVAGSEQAVSANGDILWTVQNAGYQWVRVVWTNSSGNGSLDSARANVKGA
jgi:hypothetical protein